MRTRTRLLAVLAGITLVAAACGDDDDPVAAGEPAVADPAADDEAMDDDEMADEEMSDEEMSDEMMGGTFVVTLTNTSDRFDAAASGAQPVPVGATEPGPAAPGEAYEVIVPRSAGSLSFATMFVQSNDWFWAPGPGGIALVDDAGAPVAGDVTDQVSLWDAGTEADQTPGEGADQAPRQAGPDTGDADPDTSVRPVEGFDATGYVSVTLEPADDGTTLVRIENVSADASVPGPIAPVAWAVHDTEGVLFVPGEAAPDGLEMLAEDGGPDGLVEALAERTGVATPFAPVAWAAHTGMDALVVPGTEASPGLEMLAEDGGPDGLAAELETAGVAHLGTAAVPEGASEPGPVPPGGSYVFEVNGTEGEYLSLAAMFVQSNDWFVAVRDLPLYDEAGTAVSGGHHRPGRGVRRRHRGGPGDRRRPRPGPSPGWTRYGRR